VCRRNGYVFITGNSWYGYDDKPSKTELLTGTMFLRPTDKVKELLVEWYAKAKFEKVWEQVVLNNIIGKYKFKIYPIPFEYCAIKSRPGNKEALIKCDPVVLHHQASRIWKKRTL
jgi:hypothetical protein